MYRDDQCAVCGAALPPDHIYCREHAADVDERLHRIGAVLHRMLDDIAVLPGLVDQVAPETWEWLSDMMDSDERWPPQLRLDLRLHADQVEVDVDSEPGQLRVAVQPDLAHWCHTTGAAMDAADVRAVAWACEVAQGAGAAY